MTRRLPGLLLLALAVSGGCRDSNEPDYLDLRGAAILHHLPEDAVSLDIVCGELAAGIGRTVSVCERTYGTDLPITEIRAWYTELATKEGYTVNFDAPQYQPLNRWLIGLVGEEFVSDVTVADPLVNVVGLADKAWSVNVKVGRNTRGHEGQD